MKLNEITRKDFIKKSSLSIMGMAFSPEIFSPKRPLEIAINSQYRETNAITLNNVRLETGFDYDGNEVVQTKTELFTVTIANGKISSVSPNEIVVKDAVDAKGMLMLPAFRDMHIHLDKTYYGGPWKAIETGIGGVKRMISLEQEILPEMLKDSTYRAEKLIELLQSKGTSFARSHVNIEPTSRLKSLRNLEVALHNKRQGFTAELVAFPQHGIFYTNSAPYMKEAAQADIDFIGGLDPYSIDGMIEKSLDFTIQLALDYDKGIDIHLHESGESGLKTLEYLIRQVEENPSLKNKTFISHAFILARLDKNKQEVIAERLAESGIGIISTIPIGKTIMPIPTLFKHNVRVLTGNDSVVDHWGTWGTGSVLEKANTMAQLYNYSTEFDLSRSLKLATDNLLPLTDKGKRQWPKVGDEASVVLIDASCSAEAVSRISPVMSLIHKGVLVYNHIT